MPHLERVGLRVVERYADQIPSRCHAIEQILTAAAVERVAIGNHLRVYGIAQLDDRSVQLMDASIGDIDYHIGRARLPRDSERGIDIGVDVLLYAAVVPEHVQIVGQRSGVAHHILGDERMRVRLERYLAPHGQKVLSVRRWKGTGIPVACRVSRIGIAVVLGRT